MLEVPWTEYRQEKGSRMVPCQEKIIPRRYSGASQAFLARNFRLLIFSKNKKIKKKPVLAYVRRKTCPELTYEGQKSLTPIQTGTAFVGKLSQLYLYLFAAVLN